MANTKFEIILAMLFLKLNNANMSFGKKTFMWKTYIINKALSITKQVQIINKKDFVIVVLDADSKIFMMYMAIYKWEKILIYSKKQAQIKA